jgi:hypothetical protein
METHLFNAARHFKMERSYKAFFVDVKVQVSLLCKDKLDDKALKHLTMMIRNFKIVLKSSLWMAPVEDHPPKPGDASDPREQVNMDASRPVQESKDDRERQAASSKHTLHGTRLQMVAEPPPTADRSNYCHMDYSLYDIEASDLDFFQNVSRFSLYFQSTGDLDVVAEPSASEASITLHLMLGLKKIVISDSRYRDNISEAVVKAITGKLRSAFAAPLQRILCSASGKLDGPLIHAIVLRCLPQAASILHGHDAAGRARSDYFHKTLADLAVLDGESLIACLVRHVPNIVDVQAPDQAGPRLLVFTAADCNVVFVFDGPAIADIRAYQIDGLQDRPLGPADLDQVLGKSLMLAMAALWSDLPIV